MSTSPASRTLRIASTIGLVVAVGVIAVVLRSSSLVSAIIGAVTVGAVVLDVLLHARVEIHEPALDPSPDKITVDLSRRS